MLIDDYLHVGVSSRACACGYESIFTHISYMHRHIFSKIKVIQQTPWKSCELDSSWTTEVFVPNLDK